MNVLQIQEGDYWTDGWFGYIAYRKDNGSMAIRDEEGFDYSLQDWASVLGEPDTDVRAVQDDMDGAQRIAQWLASGGSLDRSVHEEIRYMECRGCGEVFEQTNGSSKPIPEALDHAKRCSGGFRRNLTEDEAF